MTIEAISQHAKPFAIAYGLQQTILQLFLARVFWKMKEFKYGIEKVINGCFLKCSDWDEIFRVYTF
jgi:uncharacterized membrane protein